MKNCVIIFLTIVCWTNLMGNSFQSSHIPKKDTLVFLLTDHNNISVQAILNHTDTVALMFHTAVGSVSLTPERSKQFRINKKEEESQSTSWSGKGDVTYVEDNVLTISQFKWEDITIWLDLLSGPETDGKFGPNLFEDKVIEINYDHNIIVLHDKEGLILVQSIFQTFELKANDHNSLIVEAQMRSNDVIVNHDFMLHSGYGGTVILDDQIQSDNEVFGSLPVIEEKTLKDSFGNDIRTKKVILDHFDLFGFELDNMPLSYFDSQLEIQKTSVIGGQVLKRFNLFIDMARSKIHVAKNKYTNLPFKMSLP